MYSNALLAQEVQNKQTNSLCALLGSELATCLILEIEDSRKANRDYLTIMDGIAMPK